MDTRIQRNSRILENSRKNPGLMEFRNSALKIQFKDKKCVGIIPYTLKLAKNKLLPEKVQIYKKFEGDSRNDGILEFRIRNQVLGKNWTILGSSWNHLKLWNSFGYWHPKHKISQHLRPNSCLVTKIKLNWYPVHHNWKKWPFPCDTQSSRKFLEVSRNDEILKFCV